MPADIQRMIADGQKDRTIAIEEWREDMDADEHDSDLMSAWKGFNAK